MNHVYRLVFNRALGVLQVVSEIARRVCGGPASGGGTVTATLPRLRFAMWCALGFVGLAATLDTSPVYAQQAQGRITGDASAPGSQRPTVLDNGSGVPVVNITTPSAAGVSRNTYSQFDVGTQGAILNNSRGNATTQLGGQIAGNPWLATGSAKVILNEVNGPASQLNGYVEVAGQRAEVVIANPAGIQVNGGGFINASQATLTTGTPVFNGGSLDHYRVTGGAIRIHGNGFNTRGTDGNGADYTDLIARSVEVNAGLWANDLRITTGTNTVSADHTQVTAQTPSAAAPQFALDVSALGGMYANKIALVGTEDGVGVRNAGTIGAQAGELTLKVDGRIQNTGALQAQTNTRVDANGGVANAGTVSAGRELTITTPADLDNSGGTVNAQRIDVNASALANRGGTIEQTGAQGLALNAHSVSNRDGGRIGLAAPAAGGGAGGGNTGGGNAGGDTGDSNGGETGGEVVLPPLPEPLPDGVLNIAGTLNNDGGRINAGGGVQLNTATGLSNDGGHLGLRELAITQGDLSNDGGELTVTGDARVHAGRIGNDAGRLEVGGALDLDAQIISNRAGTISHSGTTDARVHAGTFDNTDGTLANNANALDVSGDVIVNERGRIEHAGAGSLSLTANTLRGAEGVLVTNGAATLALGNADHRGATVSTTQLTLNAAGFDNRGGQIFATGTDANTLNVTGTLDNGDEGLIASAGELSITAGILGNAGGTVQQAGAGILAIDATTLYGAGGTLASNGALTLKGNTTDLRGGTTSAQSVGVDTGTLVTAGGTLTSAGTDALQITARDRLDNTAGTIATGGTLQVTAGALTNVDGTLHSAGADAAKVTVAGTLDNTRGLVAGNGAFDIGAGTLVNRDTRTDGKGVWAEQLTVNANHVDNASGQLGANDVLTVTTAALDNTGGSITAANALIVDATTLTGANGTIGTNGTLALRGETTDLRGGTTTANTIELDTGALTTAGGSLIATGTDALDLRVRDALDNAAGTIATNGALQLAAGTLGNQGGTISAAGTDATDVRVANAFDNTDGTLVAAGALDVHAGEFVNTNGVLQSAGDAGLTVTADGRLVNDGGTIASNGGIALNARSMTNAGGTVQTQRAVTANVAGTLDNSGGIVVAGGDLTVAAGTLLNRDTFDASATDPSAQKGLHGPRVDLSADTIDNTRGQVHAPDALTLRGRTQPGTALTNAGGAIDGTGAVSVAATAFDNAAGTLIQRGTDGALTLNVDGMLSNTDSGLIGAEGRADVQAGTLDNSAGTLFAKSALVITTAGDLLNRNAGLLQSNGEVTVNAGGALDNTDGAIDATGRGTLTAGRIDNVRGQILAGGADATALTVNTAALNNQGGTVGTRDGDLALNVANVDNSAGGRLVAQRDITFATNTLNNAGATVFANRAVSYENAAGALNNAGGQFGAGESAHLTLANLSNTNAGRIQAGAVWLNTPTLDLGGNGEIVGNEVHAQLAMLTGDGRLYGTQRLDVDISGDFTYGNGPRLESDVLLDLAVAGRFTNQGTLQTAGELALSATDVINESVINGSDTARITASGTIDNRAGAGIEGDTVALTARDVINSSREGIIGDSVTITADTLTNGRDLGTAKAAVDYGEGFIGAADYLDLRIGHRLSNLDGDIYSGGDMSIAGRTDGTRVASLDNVSGRIQAEGNATIAAERLDNRRRMVGVETYTLTPDEQYALGSQRQFDEAMAAMTPAERQRLQYLNSRGAANLSAAEILEKKALNHKVGWQTVDHVSDAMLAAINTWYRTIGAAGYGASDGYVIDNAATPDDNPGAEVIQRDTYTTGQRLVDAQTSAASQITTGGDLTIDAGQRVRNYASQIAAGGYLTIAGQSYSGTGEGSDAAIENIAVAGQLSGERETQAWVYPEIPAMYLGPNGWRQTIAELQGFMHEDITADGPTLAKASITAGQGLSISAGDVTNTSVSAGSGLSNMGGGDLNGAGSTGLGNAAGASAGSAGSVGGAQAVAVGSREGQGSTSGQVIGTPERPLPGLVASDNGMFDLHADPNSPFLMTTAPRFAKGDGTGSNYLLNRLGVTTDLHKRLGDGYYEQRLVLEQILALTGRRSLTGNGDGFEQYRVLMDHAADEAGRLGLTLGAPLTSAQIGALNQDIVWLVEQEVNGQKVLVPVVYLSKATADKMKAEGALMAADTVDIQSTGKVHNDGSVDSTRGTWLSADTLINDGAIRSEGRVDIATVGDTHNRGQIKANTVAIDAGGDMINTVRFDGLKTSGGVIAAGPGGLSVSAGRDVVNQGTMSSDAHAVVSVGRDFVQNAATANTTAGGIKAPAGSLSAGGSAVVSAGRDAVLTQSSIDAGQHAVIDAGRDAKFIASDVTAGGSIAVTAGHDIVSETVTDTSTYRHYESVKEGKKKTTTTTTTVDETVRGSNFHAGGDVAMVADNDITLTSATVRSDNGGIALAAGNNLTLNTEQENHSVVVDSTSKKKNTLSKTTTTTHSEVNDSYAIGTTLSGERVDLSAGNDMLLQGALVAGDKGVTAVAGGNITIETGVNTHTESSRTDSKKSGAFGNGGIGFTVGTRKTGNTLELQETTHTGTLIGSSEGRVDIVAGKDVTITGSDVLSNTGTLISGENVTIQHAENTLDVTQTQYAKQGGLNVSVKGGVADVAMTVYDSAKRADEVEDDRLKGLYAAKAGQALFSDAAGRDGMDGIDQFKDLKNFDPTMVDGKPKNAGGMSLRIGIGSSSSESGVTTHEITAQGSNIRSNGDIAVIARTGNLTVTGSHIEGENVGLAAAKDILLRSAKETTEQRERSQARSGEIGVTVGTEAGIGVYVSASAASGKGEGASTSHAETVVKGNQSVSFVSGGNTTLEGAQIIAERVAGSVGGDFTVRSQQDTDTYKRKDQSGGVDAAVGIGGGQVAVNYAQTKINSDYTSAREQSGIQAGSGGFQIDVKGHTQLDGGAIASTADPSKNYFSTGSLGFTDLKNEAEYKATSVSVSASGGTGGGGVSGGISPPQNEKSSSTTKAGIADGTLIVKDGSGSDIAKGVTELQQDGLKAIYDAQKVAERMEIGQVAGQVGMTAAGDLAKQMGWAEGSKEKAILHGVVGAGIAALSGGDVVGGLTGAAANQLAFNAVAAGLDKMGIKEGTPEFDSYMSLASIAIGAAVGGGSGASTAFAGDLYNRQLHPDEIKFLQNDKVVADYIEYMAANGVTLTEDQARISLDRYGAAGEDAHRAAVNGRDPLTEAFLDKESKGRAYTDSNGNQHAYFQSTKDEYKDETINLNALYGNRFDPAVRTFLDNNRAGNGGASAQNEALYYQGQQLGYAEADREAGWLNDLLTMGKGTLGLAGSVINSGSSDQVGPIDELKAKNYYQMLLKDEGRWDEAGYVDAVDWATAQRLTWVGLAAAELGGTALGQAAKAIKGGGAPKPVVVAEAEVGGSIFKDTNQSARPPAQADANQPTLISDRVASKVEADGKPKPNGNMADAHAEVGTIQQAFEAGKTQGSEMSMTVKGEPVCGFCRGDIAAMAEKAGLKSLVIKEEKTGKTLYWQPGMRTLKEKR